MKKFLMFLLRLVLITLILLGYSRIIKVVNESILTPGHFSLYSIFCFRVISFFTAGFIFGFRNTNKTGLMPILLPFLCLAVISTTLISTVYFGNVSLLDNLTTIFSFILGINVSGLFVKLKFKTNDR